MKQYLSLLQNIIDNGVEKESGRDYMPKVLGISHAVIQMNLKDGFPLLTTKKMPWKLIVHELLWFLRGETNIKYLVDNNVHIWDKDAYRWYLKYCTDNKISTYFPKIENFVTFIRDTFISIYYDSMNNIHYELKDSNNELNEHLTALASANYIIGDLGKVYGYQWRNQNGVDQIKDLIDGLKNNPYGRRNIIDTWNKSDFHEMALPPCHLLYQFIVRPLTSYEREDIYFNSYKKEDIYFDYDDEGHFPNASDTEVHNTLDEWGAPKFYLDVNMYQRSGDSFLGVPFNIASMSLLLMIISKTCNMVPGIATWIGGDTHLYIGHIPMAKEQLKRECRKLPQMLIKSNTNSLEDIVKLTINDFELTQYDNPHPSIKAELFTGLKK